MYFNKNSMLRNKRAKPFIILTIVMAVLGGMFIYYTWNTETNRKTTEAMHIANVIAMSLNGEMSKKITGIPEDLGTTNYEHIKKRLMELYLTDKEFRYAYICTQRNGKIFFMVDSEPTNSKDYSSPGQEYTEASQLFIDVFTTGNAIIEEDTDRWGTWVSVLIPMKDSNGKIYAVFGIDYPKNEWYLHIILHTAQSALIVLLFIILIYAFLMIVIRNSLIKENSDRLNNIIEGTNVGTWEWNVKTGETRFNERWAEIIGYTLDDIKPVSIQTWVQYAHPEDMKFSEALLGKVISGEKTYYDCECRMRHKDGNWVWVHDRGKVTKWDADGKPLWMSGSHMDITEKKNFEEKLKNSEMNFRTFFETVDDMVFVANNEGEIFYTNATVLHKLGYSREELTSMQVLDIHPVDKRAEAEQIFGDMFAGRRSTCPLPLAKKDGTFIPVETRVWFGKWDGTDCIFGISKDLSKEQAAYDKFHKLFESNPALMAVSNIVDKKLVDVNSAFLETLGFSREEVIGKTVQELNLFIDIDHQIEIANILNKEGYIRNIDLKVRRKDGQIMEGLFSGEIIDNQLEKSFLTVMIDITEIKKAEVELKETTARLELATRAGGVGVWDYNIPKNNLLWDDQMYKLYGIEKKDFKSVYQSWRDGLHPDDLERGDKEIQMAISGEKEFDTEFRVCWPDGTIHHIRAQAIIEKDELGQPLHMIGTNWDITENKQMESDLFIEKEQFKTTLLSVGDGVISTDVQGNVLIMNKISEQLTGWTQEEAVGKPMEEVFYIINEFTRERCENPASKVLESGDIIELANHTILVSKEGIERPIEDSAAPIKDEQGIISGVVLVFRDFTEKKQKQAEIEYLSYNDQLTGLYNRRYYEQEIVRLDDEQYYPLTLIMVDVNGLKLTNDAFGHKTGDKLLQKISDVLKRECRENDIVARIGGDEFVILLPETDAKNAEVIIDRINTAIKNEKIDNLILSISVGFAVKQEESENITEVFMKAEDDMYRHKLSESSSIRSKTIDLIMNTLFEKNKREMLHSHRVGAICEAIAKNMDFTKDEINEIKIAGLMHDIGKIGISEAVLNSPNKLDDDEWHEIKRHSEIGYRILSSVNEFSQIANIVLEHHERFNGSGYPKGLKGDEISLQARIIAVADAYDAMTKDRTYRKALTKDEAIVEMKRCAGTQFDSEVLCVFFEKVMKKEFEI